MTAQWIDIEGPSEAHVFSKTSAHILISKSPLHARLRKMRDAESDDETEDEKRTKEDGTIAHAMLLRAGKKIVLLDYENYRTKAAQQARDDARQSGAVPILARREPWFTRQIQRIRQRLEAMGIVFDGRSEAGIAWTEETTDGSADEVECVGALDHWSHARRMIVDCKFGRSAHPESARKEIYRLGGDIQAAAYTSAVAKAHPDLAGRVRFVFVFCELYSGAVTPIELDGDFRRLGELRWQRAVNTWARCLREDHWPGYATSTMRIGPPGWAIEAEMAEHYRSNETSNRPAGNDAGEEIEDGYDDE